MRWRVYSQLAEQSQTRRLLGLCGVWQGVTARERRQSSSCQLQVPLDCRRNHSHRRCSLRCTVWAEEWRMDWWTKQRGSSLHIIATQEVVTERGSYRSGNFFIRQYYLQATSHFVYSGRGGSLYYSHPSFLNLSCELTGRMIWFLQFQSADRVVTRLWRPIGMTEWDCKTVKVLQLFERKLFSRSLPQITVMSRRAFWCVSSLANSATIWTLLLLWLTGYRL